MKGKKILVVDDESDILAVVKMRLEAGGYEIISASDGQDGLEKAKKENPDLIILDLMLPKMDGYKVCGLLKADTRYRKVPVIMFTAKSCEEVRQICDEVRADAYLTKPFDPPVLLGKIRELLGDG